MPDKNRFSLKTGAVLISEPFMQDPNFKRSVVVLADYDKKEGTIGFIMNKSVEMQIGDLIADFPDFESEVYYGGPVQADTIHYIHNLGDLIEESTEISRGVYWGGDFEKLKFLIESKMVKPENVRFFIGYSGWAPGQLESEMDIRSWVSTDMDANYLFKVQSDDLWEKTLTDKGDHYSVIAQFPDQFSVN